MPDNYMVRRARRCGSVRLVVRRNLSTFDPQLGFLLSALKTIHNTAPGGIVTDTTIALKDAPFYNVKNANFSLGFRVGGEIGIRKHTLFIESVYDFGLTDVQEAEFDGRKWESEPVY